MGLDPFREMAGALRSRTGFDGTVVKFNKGRWPAGKEASDMSGRELNAHVDQLMYGYTKWEDKKPVDYHVGFVRDRYKPPKRRDLGDNDSNKWERPDQDPWQLTFFLPLTDPNTGQLFIYSTTSRGGKDALANLQDAYADNREFHPEAASKLPVICLTSNHYQHPDYGRVETPAFDIVRWVDPPKNAKQVRPPAATTAPLALEHAKKHEAADEEPDSVGDFEDEIPF